MPTPLLAGPTSSLALRKMSCQLSAQGATGCQSADLPDAAPHSGRVRAPYPQPRSHYDAYLSSVARTAGASHPN